MYSLTKTFAIQTDLCNMVHEVTYFCHAASEFNCKIEIKANGHKADGKSIINIMALGIKKDSEIEITAIGTDATQAMTRLEEILQLYKIIT